MFGLSFSHLILLAVIAFIVIGPEKLPELARTLGRLLNEFKRATSGLNDQIMDAKSETDKMMSGIFDQVAKATDINANTSNQPSVSNTASPTTDTTSSMLPSSNQPANDQAVEAPPAPAVAKQEDRPV